MRYSTGSQYRPAAQSAAAGSTLHPTPAIEFAYFWMKKAGRSGSVRASKRCGPAGLDSVPLNQCVTRRPVARRCEAHFPRKLPGHKRTSISHTRALPPMGTRLSSCLEATGCRLRQAVALFYQKNDGKFACCSLLQQGVFASWVGRMGAHLLLKYLMACT